MDVEALFRMCQEAGVDGDVFLAALAYSNYHLRQQENFETCIAAGALPIMDYFRNPRWA